MNKYPDLVEKFFGLPSVSTALHQLPAPPADFTGRTNELDELLGRISKSGVTISGLRGMGVDSWGVDYGLSDGNGEVVEDPLGLTYAGLGDAPRAMDYDDQSLTLAVEIGDQRGQARALLNQGMIYHYLGQRDEAIDHAEAAQKIFEEVEDANAAHARELLSQWRQGR